MSQGEHRSGALRAAETLQLVFLCLFAGTLCFRRDVNQSFLIASLVFSLPLFRLARWRANAAAILVLSGVYLVAALSMAWSAEHHEGWLVLERQLTLLLLPFVYGGSMALTGEKIKRVAWSFSAGVAAACVYLWIVCYEKFLSSDQAQLQEFLKDEIHHQFSAPIGMHATYLSMYACFSMAVCLRAIISERMIIKIAALLLLAVFFASLVMLSSRIVFVPLVLILFVVFPLYLRPRVALTYLAAIGIIMATMFIVLKDLAAFRMRFKTDTLRELNIGPGNPVLSFSDVATDDATRAERWKCALELAAERPVLGYGTGDEKSMLNVKYKKYNFSNSILNNFDAHNQYFAFMIKSGLLGLLTFLVQLAYSGWISIRHRNLCFIAFVLVIVVTSLTEDILESNKGILFFALFNTLYVLWLSDSPKENSRYA